MAEATPPPTEPSGTAREYKPLSGMALAAIGVAGLFAVILLAVVIVALVSRSPVIAIWLLLLPILGIVLAIFARQGIRRSEGTRAGLVLTNIAWWICALGGGGYAAYIFANEFALGSQSRNVAEQWFDLLREGNYSSAFLMTLEPSVRVNVSPDEAAIEARFGQAEWPAFRGSHFVRMFERHGKDVEIEHIGLHDWAQEKGSYVVIHSFQIKSPEGVATIPVKMIGTDSKEFDRRQWQIAMSDSLFQEEQKLTRYGALVKDLYRTATRTGEEFGRAIVLGDMAAAHRLTLPPDQQDQYLQVVLDDPMVSAAGLVASPTALLQSSALAKVLIGSAWMDWPLLQSSAGERLSQANLETVQEALADGRLAPSTFAGRENVTRPQVEIREDEVRATMEMVIPNPMTESYAPVELVLVTRKKELLEELKQARAEGLADPTLTDTSVTPPLEKLPPGWQIQAIRTDLEWQLRMQPPGG